jgi:hypothetical protein
LLFCIAFQLFFRICIKESDPGGTEIKWNKPAASLCCCCESTGGQCKYHKDKQGNSEVSKEFDLKANAEKLKYTQILHLQNA